LTPELAEPISRASLVFFVDAQEGAAGSDGAVGLPGQVHRYPVAPDSDGALAFSHDVDPPALLTLARVLYGACPPALVISVTGHDFGYGEGLSAPVQSALPAVLQQIRQALADHDAGVLPHVMPRDNTLAATAGPRTERG
ncbi:MAG: hypothetical protein AB7P40_09490, partial [Chloroflexota bacterium]